MSDRISNLHVGDLVRVFTYAGTTINTHTSYYHSVREDRIGDEVLNPINPDEDGLRFVGTYVAYDEKEEAIQLQVLAQNFARGHPFDGGISGTQDSTRPDLTIPKRLVRRYEILEPSYKSPVFRLE